MPKNIAVEAHVGRLSAGQPRGRRAIKEVTLALETGAAKRAEARNADGRRSERSLNALCRPLEQVIAADPAAAASLAKLRKHSFDPGPPLGRAVPPTSHLGSSMFALTLTDRLSFASAPYDYDWRWGNFLKVVTDRRTGRVGVEGRSGAIPNGSGDAVAAASGIGLVLTTDTPVNVAVRPYIEIVLWSYFAGAAGVGCNGSATGGIDAAAFHNGAFVAGVRRTVEFSASRGAGSSRDSGGGVAWIPDVELRFSMVPGQSYVVNFGAWVECDHTSSLGVGAGQALVDAYVRWIVVERGLL